VDEEGKEPVFACNTSKEHRESCISIEAEMAEGVVGNGLKSVTERKKQWKKQQNQDRLSSVGC
jgi:hypothetical protein